MNRLNSVYPLKKTNYQYVYQGEDLTLAKQYLRDEIEKYVTGAIGETQYRIYERSS